MPLCYSYVLQSLDPRSAWSDSQSGVCIPDCLGYYLHPTDRSRFVFRGVYCFELCVPGWQHRAGPPSHEEIACTEIDSTEHPLGLNRSALLVARLAFRNQRFVDSNRVTGVAETNRISYEFLQANFSQEVRPVSHCLVVHTPLVLNGRMGQLDRPIIYRVDQRTRGSWAL